MRRNRLPGGTLKSDIDQGSSAPPAHALQPHGPVGDVAADAGAGSLDAEEREAEHDEPDHDEPDIERLVQEHHGPVHRYAFRLSGSSAEAEDLTQQTFLIAQQKLDQLRDPGKARSWLFAILINTFRKSKRKSNPSKFEDIEYSEAEIPEDIPAAEDIDQELLQRTIGELPEQFRVVLLMFYFEEASYKEIAERLDVAIGTVMSRLSRAKEHMRRRLLEHEHFDFGRTADGPANQ